MDTGSNENRYSHPEMLELFRKMFPHGLRGEDVREELGIGSWQDSPFHAFYHPSPERAYEEYVSLEKHLARLRGHPEENIQSWPEFQKECTEQPCDPEEELTDLVGKCCWDIFSNNHEVFDKAGRRVDIGSFRGAGAFLAEFTHSGGTAEKEANGGESLGYERERYDYIRYYMGTWNIEGRGDLGPVYRMIFRRMKRAELVWIFCFPKMGVVEMPEHPDPSEKGSDPAQYDPSESFRREQERERKRAAITKMRDWFDKAHREVVAKARHEPAPEIVKAHIAVFGTPPRGWPP